LYLPPDHAHEGVAIDACTTYSVGFRTASTQQLATAFLDWLRDEVALDGRYADPDLRPARAPNTSASVMALPDSRLAPLAPPTASPQE